MKRLPLSLALAVLLSSSSLVAGASDALTEFKSKQLSVLVQVDAQGKVTSAVPATSLSPKMERLLRANLDEMIVSPAVDKEGHPVSSQFVANVTLQTSPRDGGDYDVNFAYVSGVPVPPGSWFWVHADGRQLALAQQGPSNRGGSVQRAPVMIRRDWGQPRPPGTSTGMPAISAAAAARTRQSGGR